LEEPQLNEGFTDVCTVDFLPHFSNENEKKSFLELV